MKFYEFQSGILHLYAIVAVPHHRPFDFNKTPKLKGWYNHEKSKLQKIITTDTYHDAPDEIYERKLTTEQLHAAIAKAEGVSEAALRVGIEKALMNLEKIFKKSF